MDFTKTCNKNSPHPAAPDSLAVEDPAVVCRVHRPAGPERGSGTRRRRRRRGSPVEARRGGRAPLAPRRGAARGAPLAARRVRLRGARRGRRHGLLATGRPQVGVPRVQEHGAPLGPHARPSHHAHLASREITVSVNARRSAIHCTDGGGQLGDLAV